MAIRHRKDIYTVSQKKRRWYSYNFDADQPILIIFGRDVADRGDLLANLT